MDVKGLGAIFKGRVKPADEKRRWDHCKGCTFLTEKNTCKKCGCFMKFKVKFKHSSCPIGIWSKEL